jgi:hypothetical protein
MSEVAKDEKPVSFVVTSVTDYRLDGRGSIPGRDKIFFF